MGLVHWSKHTPSQHQLAVCRKCSEAVGMFIKRQFNDDGMIQDMEVGIVAEKLHRSPCRSVHMRLGRDQ